MKELLNWQDVLQPTDEQTNIELPFTVPEDTAALLIDFSYSPKELGDSARSRALTDQLIQRTIPEDRQAAFSAALSANARENLSNLVTVSLYRDGDFCGAAHTMMPRVQHVLTRDRASSGFLPLRTTSGIWLLVLNLHCLVSPTLEASLQILALTHTEYDLESRKAPSGLLSRSLALEAAHVRQQAREAEQHQANTARPRSTQLTVEVAGTGHTWYPAELHSHTHHSDGAFTPAGLFTAAADREVHFLALTDHNTTSGRQAVTPELEARTCVHIPGIEWTTYFGHMVVLGAERYVDWRDATVDTIDDFLRQIKSAKGLAGIAHPGDLGTPICTGCHWDYQIKDYSLIDYIEVWNGPLPATHPFSQLSLHFYRQRLDEGWRIPLTCGLDWHGFGPEEEPAPVTLLGIPTGEEADAAAALNAIREGLTAVTYGPGLLLEARPAGAPDWQPVSTIVSTPFSPGQEELEIRLTIEPGLRKEQWRSFDIQLKELCLIGNGGKVIWSQPLQSDADARSTAQDFQVSLLVEAGLSWIQAELRSTLDHQGETIETILALTSPIYLVTGC